MRAAFAGSLPMPRLEGPSFLSGDCAVHRTEQRSNSQMSSSPHSAQLCAGLQSRCGM